MTNKTGRPFTVLVEGNIGCGKTTLLEHFSKVIFVSISFTTSTYIKLLKIFLTYQNAHFVYLP